PEIIPYPSRSGCPRNNTGSADHHFDGVPALLTRARIAALIGSDSDGRAASKRASWGSTSGAGLVNAQSPTQGGSADGASMIAHSTAPRSQKVSSESWLEDRTEGEAIRPFRNWGHCVSSSISACGSLSK